MSPRLVGNSPQERTSCLANLIVEHFVAKKIDGRTAVLRNHTNSAGHTDPVVVSCPRLGLIHVIAIGGRGQDGGIPLHREGPGQDWLVDKSYVAFGWIDPFERTVICFVETAAIRATPPKSKESVMRLANHDLTALLRL
jgi:hypothetical protein